MDHQEVEWLLGHHGGHRVRLGEHHLPHLSVAGEIFAVYQPVIGAAATLVWLNMRYAVHVDQPFEPRLLQEAGLSPDEIQRAIARLEEYELVKREGDAFIVYEPLPQGAFRARFGGVALAGREGEAESAQDQAAAADDAPRQESLRQVASWEGTGEVAEGAQAKTPLRSPLSKRRKASRMLRLVEPASSEPESENPDMQAVMQIYHKRIGMIGPTQYEKLRFWIEEQGMEGAVVALAIEETVRSAEVPRISYLEGILRNWYNDGIRTLADLHEKKRASRVLSGDEGRAKGDHSLEGSPNAAAYQSVSPEWVERWKELYPDEYDG